MSEYWYLRISELKWTGMGEFNSDDHHVYYCRQKYSGLNVVALIANKRIKNAALRFSLKNDRMYLVCFQGKWFSIIVIQVCASTSNAKQGKVDWLYEHLQHLLELTLKKRCLFHHWGLECKSRKSRDTWSNRRVWLWWEMPAEQSQAAMEARQYCWVTHRGWNHHHGLSLPTRQHWQLINRQAGPSSAWCTKLE